MSVHSKGEQGSTSPVYTPKLKDQNRLLKPVDQIQQLAVYLRAELTRISKATNEIARQLSSRVTQSSLDSQLDALYPPGTVQFFGNGTDPNTIFPGTWAQLSAGRFIVTTGTNGSDTYNVLDEGGEARHTLTKDEMPRHSHFGDIYAHDDLGGTGVNEHRHTAGTGFLGFGLMRPYVTPEGGDQPHENRPPYVALNAWLRTS